jgi:hypothetical protein
MLGLFLTICLIAAALVVAVAIAVYFIRRSVRFLTKEEETEAEYFRPKLYVNEDDEEIFI